MPQRSTHRQVMIMSCGPSPPPSLHIVPHLRVEMGRRYPPYVAFLDFEKCFDTISHDDLIIVMRDVLHLPLAWVEVIRRLLIDNTTTILDEEIAVMRGCMQGSPLSPLLCLFISIGGFRPTHAPARPRRPACLYRTTHTPPFRCPPG